MVTMRSGVAESPTHAVGWSDTDGTAVHHMWAEPGQLRLSYSCDMEFAAY